MLDKIIKLAQGEVGYKETGTNQTKYSYDFDHKYWQWFNYKKQGTAWCAIFICWLFVVVLGPEKALKFLGCPSPKNNCAAGVGFLHDYLKKTGTTVKKADTKKGDIIFFRNDAHVGICEYVKDGYIHTIEGNKGDAVARGSYKLNSTSITGVVRPAYAADEQPEPTPAPSTKYDFPTIPSRGYFKSGDRGTEVKKMQQILELVCPGCLKQYGCDGIIGYETLSAVARVQFKLHVTVDGLYGPKTNNACKKYLGCI